MNARAMPPHIKASIDRYVSHRIPTGGFLEAVLSNDLREAFGRADEQNRAAMHEIVCYIYNDIPSDAWGSVAKVKAWLNPTPVCEPGDVCPECQGSGEGPDRPHTWSSGLTEDVPTSCWDCAGTGTVQLVEGERDPAPPVLTMEDAIRMMAG